MNEILWWHLLVLLLSSNTLLNCKAPDLHLAADVHAEIAPKGTQNRWVLQVTVITRAISNAKREQGAASCGKQQHQHTLKPARC